MGYTEVKVHVKYNSQEDIQNVKNYLRKLGMEGELIQQKNYITLDSDIICFENFEETAIRISRELELNVLVALVYDSEVAVIQGYVAGIKEYEEVKSPGENCEMNRSMFVQDFFPECDETKFDEILSQLDNDYAEDILFELGDYLDIQLI